MTILPRIIDILRQADSRGARWLPITDTGTETETGPMQGRTWAQGRGGGEGEGQIQGAGAAEARLPREGTDQVLFWFPKHMDCFVSSLKYCSLTDMALTIGNGQRRHMSLSEIKA